MPLDLLVPTNGFCRIDVWGLLFNQETRTVFYYKNISGGDLSLLTEIEGAFVTDHLTALLSQQSQSWQVFNLRLTAYGVSPTFTNLGSRDVSQALLGAVGSDAAPPSVANVYRRKVGIPGRANRGRIYVPGVPLADIAGGTFTPAGQAARIVVSTALSLDLTAAAVPIMTPQLFRYDASGVLVSSQTVFFFQADPVLRSQRRREIGVGI